MPAFCHSGGDRNAETNWAGCALVVCGSKNLQDGCPLEIYVGMAGLSVVASSRVDDETIVPVYVSGKPVSEGHQLKPRGNCAIPLLVNKIVCPRSGIDIRARSPRISRFIEIWWRQSEV